MRPAPGSHKDVHAALAHIAAALHHARRGRSLHAGALPPLVARRAPVLAPRRAIPPAGAHRHAGQLQPLTVRPGRKKEAANMALDGRRRLLALRLLVEQGRIDDSFLVDVFVETDPARQAAAVLLTNTAVPVHVADIIAAIGRMLKRKLGVPTIAKALGYAEIDVKRLAALSALPDVALQALRLGRLDLRQLGL